MDGLHDLHLGRLFEIVKTQGAQILVQANEIKLLKENKSENKTENKSVKKPSSRLSVDGIFNSFDQSEAAIAFLDGKHIKGNNIDRLERLMCSVMSRHPKPSISFARHATNLFKLLAEQGRGVLGGTQTLRRYLQSLDYYDPAIDVMIDELERTNLITSLFDRPRASSSSSSASAVGTVRPRVYINVDTDQPAAIRRRFEEEEDAQLPEEFERDEFGIHIFPEQELETSNAPDSETN